MVTETNKNNTILFKPHCSKTKIKLKRKKTIKNFSNEQLFSKIFLFNTRTHKGNLSEYLTAQFLFSIVLTFIKRLNKHNQTLK